MKRLLFLLFLASCSSPKPTYEKGAYRPVRPPVFSPAEDAPHTFEPARRPDVQPGPRPTRVLPQTPETRREPGIWAGDEPRAVAGPPKLEIAGVPLPVPEPEWSVNPLEAYAPPLCHGLITHNAFSPGHALKGDALTPEQKACLVATWYKRCLSWAAEAVVDRKNKGTINIVLGHFWKRYVDPATKFEKEKCTPAIFGPLKPHADFPSHYWDDVLTSYRRTNP